MLLTKYLKSLPDMNISLKRGILSTSIHYRTTDSHSYLDYHSTKNNIPFSRFLRLCLLCSDHMDFEVKANQMIDFYLNKHYPKNIIKRTLDLVKQILQSIRVTDAEERLILSLLYHPSTICLYRIILKNESEKASAEVAKIFNHHRSHIKKDTNIRDILVRSNIQPTTTHIPRTTPCNQNKCKTYPFFCTSVEVQGIKCTMNVTKHSNCQTYDIVYVIRCTKCAKLYIGETGRTLETHFQEHLADRYHWDKPVVNHFNQVGHSIHNVRLFYG